jgi:hypothetical protein
VKIFTEEALAKFMDENEGEHVGFAPTILKEGEHAGFAPTILKDVIPKNG